MDFIKGYIVTLRPKQWTKNLLIFAAPLFAFNQIKPATLIYSVYAFILFCLLSGVVYVMNDYSDREKDRLHPKKKYRPLASGRINPNITLGVSIILLIVIFLLSFEINPALTYIFILYFVVNIFYTFYLKNVVLVDVMIIAIGFVLRAISGGFAIHVPLTSWFLLCIMLLALFMAIGKRRAELTTLNGNGGEHRKVLNHYTVDLLNQFLTIVTTLTIMSYALFTFTSDHTVYLMWTIPYVIYGVFRYLYLIHTTNEGGAPEKLLLVDRPIQMTVVLYVITVFGILYFFD
jgi:4-hydroxybenzoate polyprenyltransferase